ncbi:Dimethyl-sulfide monooxygenase [compost metagenome]
MLFQAGSSPRGLAFAGNHAECVFISGQDKAATRTQVDKVRAAAKAAGRDPQGVKVFMGITVIVAPTEQQAQAKYAEYLRYASPEAGVAHFAASTGIDFAAYGLDEPIGASTGNAIQSATRQLQENAWTRRRLLEQHALGGRYLTLVGAPEDVAEQLIAWVDETGLDGFNLTRTVTPESYEAFIELVVPQLQQRGRYKTAYGEGTLREKLFQSDHPHLPADHPGSTYRHTSTPATTGVAHHA